MKNLYIIGAGDFGREVESFLENLTEFGKEFKIIGYLDDNPNSLSGKPSGYKVLAPPLSFIFDRADYVIITITNPVTRKFMAERLMRKVNFFNYIAPNVVIGKYTTIGVGSIICSNCFISTNTIIGSFVTINAGSQIGHDCNIESYCSLMANVDIGGNVKIGEGVYAGTKSTIIPGKSISAGITIGVGSVVIKNLSKLGSYFGNPAKLISY